jgi:hypothetical protein
MMAAHGFLMLHRGKSQAIKKLLTDPEKVCKICFTVDRNLNKPGHAKMENANKTPAPIREFKAYAKDKTSAYGSNPRAAAKAFFVANASARKCNVIEGVTEYTEGVAFFVTRHGNGAGLSFPDVTRKTADALPDGAQKV